MRYLSEIREISKRWSRAAVALGRWRASGGLDFSKNLPGFYIKMGRAQKRCALFFWSK
ncbi:unnamed protein product [Phyllotreta striolata]|uniref:Uncharacterized protein n=1 Tax=Phyllotreta striolata TaxID=444603 RepID=A0A9N9XSA2_PHYSR|nr:unnamed protein product [Phyllotreta striolata]